MTRFRSEGTEATRPVAVIGRVVLLRWIGEWHVAANPAFQFYANDWLSSPTVICMTPMEELAFFRMLLFCWTSGDCSITADVERLSCMCRTDADVCSTVVQQAFIEHPTKPQHVTNKRLHNMWIERLEYVERKRIAGLKSHGPSSKRRGSKRSARAQQVHDSSSSSSSSINSASALGFVAPSAEEIVAFCAEHDINNVDAELFIDHYKTNGWMCGRTKMRDWQAAVRQWARREREFSPRDKTNGTRRPVMHSADVAKELAKDWRP